MINSSQRQAVRDRCEIEMEKVREENRKNIIAQGGITPQ